MKTFRSAFWLLLLAVSSFAQTHTEVTIEDAQTITAKKSLTSPTFKVSPWIDVTDVAYGADSTGVSDVTTAVQAAINAIPTGVTKGGALFFPCGTYKFRNNTILIPVNTPIEIMGEGQCVNIQKDFDSVGSSPVYNSVFTTSQTYATNTTLTANAAKGDQQITVTSTTGFTAGNWILFNDNTGFTGFNCLTYTAYEPSLASCNEEIQQIDTVVDATHLNLKTSLTNAYTTAGVAKIYTITPVYLHIHDLSFINGPDCSVANQCSGRYLDLIHCLECEIDHNSFDIPLDVAVQLHRSKHSRVFSNAFANAPNSQSISGQSAYSLVFDEGTQFVEFNDNTVYKQGQLAVVSQSNNLMLENNTFNGCGDSCINTHGHLNHDIIIQGNKFSGIPAGSGNGSTQGYGVAILDTDYNITVCNNNFLLMGRQAISVSSLAQANTYGINICNNEVTDVITNSAGTFPPNYMSNTVTTPNSAIFATRLGAGSNITGNIIRASFPSGAVALRCQGCTGTTIAYNQVTQLNGAAASEVGIYVDSLTGANTANMDISHNTVTGFHSANCQLAVPSGTFSASEFDHNTCYGGPGANYTIDAAVTTLERFGNQGDTVNWLPGMSLGSTALPITDIIIGGQGANKTIDFSTSLLTANRTAQWPDNNGVVAELNLVNAFSAAQRGTQWISDQGTACTNGELALSAGWQSTGSATVTAVAGTGQTCSWTITTGTTTAANPTITDTLTNALPSASTVCWMNIYGGTHTAVAGESLRQTTLSATAPIFTANFTPTAAGTTYFVTRGCGP